MEEQILHRQRELPNRSIQDLKSQNLDNSSPSPYLSIRDFAKLYSTWTESSIRWLIYNNTENFNGIVVRRVGKSKILLSVADFWKWIEMQNQKRVMCKQ